MRTSHRHGITIGHLYFLILHFFILGYLLLFSYFGWGNYQNIMNWSQIISATAAVLFVIHLISFLYLKLRIGDFRFWFIMLLYPFMFGRVVLHSLNLDNEIFWDLMSRHPSDLLYHTSLFILCCIQSLFIGLTLFKRNKKNRINIISIDRTEKNFYMYKGGLLLLFLSLPFRLLTDVQWIIQTQGAGSYSAISSSSGLSDDFAFLAVPSILYIIASGKPKKKTSFLIVLITVLYFLVVMTLTGDRRYPVTAILAIILCYFSLYNFNISLFKKIILGFGAYLLLNTLTVIRKIRDEGLTSFWDFITEHGMDILIGTSTIYETLAELGLTFFSVVIAFKYIPSYLPFQDGFSFIATIPSILPIGWLFNDFFAKAVISGVLNPVEGTTVGASIIGDLYGNFGWFAIFISIIFGMILYKIFGSTKFENRISIAKYYSLFYILINLIRAAFFEVFRPTILVYFVPLIFVWLLSSKEKHRLKNSICLEERKI